MKRILYVFLFLICVGFVACSKEPSNNEITAPEGQTWRITKKDYYLNGELSRTEAKTIDGEFGILYVYFNKVFVYQGNLTLIRTTDEMDALLRVGSYSVLNNIIISDLTEKQYKIFESDNKKIVLQEIGYFSHSERTVLGAYNGVTIYTEGEYGRLMEYGYYLDADGIQYKCDLIKREGGVIQTEYGEYDYEFCRYTFELVEE